MARAFARHNNDVRHSEPGRCDLGAQREECVKPKRQVIVPHPTSQFRLDVAMIELASVALLQNSVHKVHVRLVVASEVFVHGDQRGGHSSILGFARLQRSTPVSGDNEQFLTLERPCPIQLSLRLRDSGAGFLPI